MRFLNTTTLKFEQVPDSELYLDKNQYAILSHRWFTDENEVSYDDLVSSTDVSHKKGFAKIQGFCRLASAANCCFGWVDTCCINKGNSSELSEAINSMYLWYSCSKICFAYLGDVPDRKLEDSEWFDRGWTLQELIAPKEVSFYDWSWNPLGTKTDLLTELSRKTRIPETILSHTSKPSTCSVAQRFSWAATRTTTKIEDRAYSLMGLFDINMPMIYGERENAFLRLQQHITQKNKDESIFAWPMELLPDPSLTCCGLYAPSPSVFINSNDVIQIPGSRGFYESNGELHLRLEIFRQKPWRIAHAILNCANGDSPDANIFIILVRIGGYSMSDEYVRVRDELSLSHGTMTIPREAGKRESFRVPVDPTIQQIRMAKYIMES